MTQKSHAGFSLIEMLVVMGIIAVLVGASLGGYSFVTRRAEQARGRELVLNMATALNVLFQRQNRWPTAILTEGQGDGRLTEQVAKCLAANNLIGDDSQNIASYDRYGVVTPWAVSVLKRRSAGGANLSTPVPSGGTIQDHQLHFAIDVDGDGFVEARLASRTVKVRANAVVWCWGMNGQEDDYAASMAGRGKADDIYSWTRGQEAD